MSDFKSIFEEKLKFNRLGYNPIIQKRGHSYVLTVNKMIALGNNLQSGKKLFAYLGEDQTGRSFLMVYLDGSPRKNASPTIPVEYNAFIEASDSC